MARNNVMHFTIDENESDRRMNKNAMVKKFAPNEIKRSALGELGNKVYTRAQQKETLNVKEKPIDLKNVKPRVDCHWQKTTKPIQSSTTVQQKSSDPATTTTATTSSSALGKVTIKNIVVIPPTKQSRQIKVARSSSLRSTTSSTASSGETKITTLKSKEFLQNIQKLQISSTKETESTNNIIIIDEPKSHSYALLNQIENIDENDADPQLCSEYVNDIYNYLHEIETRFTVSCNYLEKQTEITPKMRSVLIDWINEVHYQFQLVPETFYIAVSLIDRYLQIIPTGRKQLQLVGCTALFLATKYEDMYPPNIDDFVYITDKTYSAEQIREMEMSILKTLDFEMGQPLAIHFLRRFSKAAKAEGVHHLLSKYFMELVLIDYKMIHYKPSEIAAASLLLALLLVSKRNFFDTKIWTSTLEYYSTYNLNYLKPITQKIADLVKNAPKGKLQAVYTKYASSKFEKISTKSYFNVTTLDALISAK